MKTSEEIREYVLKQIEKGCNIIADKNFITMFEADDRAYIHGKLIEDHNILHFIEG